MHFKHLLKGLTIGTPILAAAVLTACHSESDIVGKYVNPNNPKQILIIKQMKDMTGINNGRPLFHLKQNFDCDNYPSSVTADLKDNKLININTDKVNAVVSDGVIDLNAYGCSITYKKVDD